MELFPAVDLHEGRAVRLVQGDFEQVTDYGDPLVLARRFVEAGARWLHVVDLDAALSGVAANRAVVVRIAEEAGVPVQAGGGVRGGADLDELLGAGVARVVLGTVAAHDPPAFVALAARHPGRVALGLDYRVAADGRLLIAANGWTRQTARDVLDLLYGVAGAPLGAVVVTAIHRDGMLEGPDFAALSDVLDTTTLPVVASGGVGGPADLRTLAGLRGPVSGRGLAGAIVGKALVDGRLSVEEALEACASSG